MKKWMCALSVCAVTGAGMLGFAGCGTSEEISCIKMKSLPTTTQFTVGDVITPALNDGVFTVEYTNGRKTDMHLNNADIVYIDYADGSTSNEFNQPADIQVVVVRYKSKTTTFNVSVQKNDLVLDYKKSYSKEYNGNPQSINDVLSLGLPYGVSITKIEYRLSGTAEYGVNPVNAGLYEVRVTLAGGAKYNDLVLSDITFEIRKTNIDFALDVDSLAYNSMFVQYGDKVDVSRNWCINGSENKNDIFANALKAEYINIANSVQYAYRKNGQAEYTILPASNDGVFLTDLNPGAYKLRAYVRDIDNIQDFYYETDLVIAAKELKYGEDYKFVISNGASVVDYVPANSAMDITTVLETNTLDLVSVRVVFLNEKALNKLKGDVKVSFVYSPYNVANWTGEGVSTPYKYGDYKLVLSAEFEEDICYFENSFHGIKIVSEE